MESLQKKILNHIITEDYKAFTSADFISLGNYKNISKSLELLEDSNKIRRVIRGVYDIPSYNHLFKSFEMPNVDEIAKAIARQYNWVICPSGNYALNFLGLNLQVPSKYIYISSGPYREYYIGKIMIVFKHSTSRALTTLEPKILITIQAVKTIGKDSIDDEEYLNRLKKYLVGYEKEIKNMKVPITTWIHEKLLEIIDDKNV